MGLRPGAVAGVGMRSIAEITFFKGVADFDITAFDRRCLWKRVDEGQTIVDFDEPSTAVYFLLAGDVRILLRTPGGKEFILADMRAGEVFGELSAIDGKQRSANVTALTQALVCVAEGPVFQEMLARSPLLSSRMMQLLTQRIRQLNARMLEHAMLDIRHNLYAELLRLSIPRAGQRLVRVVTPPPFHHVLAARIGCRREQVTRELRVMEQDGFLEKARGALILKRSDDMKNAIAKMMSDLN